MQDTLFDSKGSLQYTLLQAKLQVTRLQDIVAHIKLSVSDGDPCIAVVLDMDAIAALHLSVDAASVRCVTAIASLQFCGICSRRFDTELRFAFD